KAFRELLASGDGTLWTWISSEASADFIGGLTDGTKSLLVRALLGKHGDGSAEAISGFLGDPILLRWMDLELIDPWAYLDGFLPGTGRVAFERFTDAITRLDKANPVLEGALARLDEIPPVYVFSLVPRFLDGFFLAAREGRAEDAIHLLSTVEREWEFSSYGGVTLSRGVSPLGKATWTLKQHEWGPVTFVLRDRDLEALAASLDRALHTVPQMEADDLRETAAWTLFGYFDMIRGFEALCDLPGGGARAVEVRSRIRAHLDGYSEILLQWLADPGLAPLAGLELARYHDVSLRRKVLSSAAAVDRRVLIELTRWFDPEPWEEFRAFVDHVMAAFPLTQPDHGPRSAVYGRLGSIRRAESAVYLREAFEWEMNGTARATVLSAWLKVDAKAPPAMDLFLEVSDEGEEEDQDALVGFIETHFKAGKAVKAYRHLVENGLPLEKVLEKLDEHMCPESIEALQNWARRAPGNSPLVLELAKHIEALQGSRSRGWRPANLNQALELIALVRALPRTTADGVFRKLHIMDLLEAVAGEADVPHLSALLMEAQSPWLALSLGQVLCSLQIAGAEGTWREREPKDSLELVIRSLLLFAAGDPGSREALKPVLEKLPDSLVGPVLGALHRSERPGAEELISTFLESKNHAVRAMAVRTLVQFGPTGTKKALARFLHGPDRNTFWALRPAIAHLEPADLLEFTRAAFTLSGWVNP
ncbi:MAG: HEAT repeat domain-containing protein, partial [Planctomycetota bacterium]